MAKVETRALPALRQLIRRELDGLPDFKWDRRSEYDNALEDAVKRLRALGFEIVIDWRGATVKAAGIKSHSTTGARGALNNWHAAAGKALDREVLSHA